MIIVLIPEICEYIKKNQQNVQNYATKLHVKQINIVMAIQHQHH